MKKGFIIIFHRYFFYTVAIFLAVYLGYNFLVDEGVLNEPGRDDFIYGIYEEEIDTLLVENYIFDMTNQIRVREGLSELGRAPDLDNLARYHSKNMALYNFFDHIDHKGMDQIDRAELLDIDAWVDKGDYEQGISENIGLTPWHSNVEGCGDTTYNYETSFCIVQGWVNSPGHYENILGDYTEIGVGIAFDKESNEVYATQNFR